jgi:hypothetical protein
VLPCFTQTYSEGCPFNYVMTRPPADTPLRPGDEAMVLLDPTTCGGSLPADINGYDQLATGATRPGTGQDQPANGLGDEAQMEASSAEEAALQDATPAVADLLRDIESRTSAQLAPAVDGSTHLRAAGAVQLGRSSSRSSSASGRVQDRLIRLPDQASNSALHVQLQQHQHQHQHQHQQEQEPLLQQNAGHGQQQHGLLGWSQRARWVAPCEACYHAAS